MKYEELYRYGVIQLKRAFIEEADLDARLLLEEICGTDRNYLIVHGMENVTKEKEIQFRSDIEKRCQHIPLQHILGYQEFMGLRFEVSPKVLIPRQDTETLVEEALRFVHDGMRILDICTGSGCILLSLLHYSNDCIGTGTDISSEALEVATWNAKQLSLSASFCQSDLFENINDKYDIIVSNPPYIPSKIIPTLMEEVKSHDPLMALDGGDDGLSFYRKIISEVGKFLYKGGMSFFEIGWDQAEEVTGYMENAGFQDIIVYKDLGGLNRVVSGVYGGF